MKLIKSVIHFYLQSSLHVSFAVLAFTLVTYFEYDFPINKSILGFIFFGTITGYNFVKYAGIAGLHHRGLAKNLKLIQLFSLLCFGFFVYYLFQVSQPVIVTSALLGLLTLLYVVPFFNNKNLRSLNGLKIFIVALVWAGVTVIVPWVDFENSLRIDVWITFAQRNLWVVVLMIPFEIRDLIYDIPSMGTVPQKLGIKKAKYLGYLFLIVIVLLQGFKDEIRSEFTFGMLVIVIITGIFVKFSRIDQSKIYTAFWVEAIPIFWLVLTILLNNYLFIS